MKPKVNKIREFIIQEAKKDSLCTWWMSNFYENFCEFMGLNFENIIKNSKKIRYYLYKFTKEGILISKSGGTGICGKSDFGFAHSNNWFLRENYPSQYKKEMLK